MGHIDYQNPRSMLFCCTYDHVCIFAIFSNLFGIVMAGCVLMEVKRRSNKPSSKCQRVLEVIVWWELLAMSVLWQCSNSYSARYGLKPIPLNILSTSHPKNHTDCHLHHQHALRNTCRLTFNRNVVKLLDVVLEWQNPYSVTVDVVVPVHNVTYSRIWLLIKGWMSVCSCVSRMVSVSKPSTDRIG